VLLVYVRYLERQTGEATNEHLLFLWSISSDRLNNELRVACVEYAVSVSDAIGFDGKT
jgi:hypothetical protein